MDAGRAPKPVGHPPPDPPRRVEDALRARARELGFSHFGIVRAEPSDHMAFYRAWIEAGRHGAMSYLAREDAVARRADPAASMPDVRSIIVVGDVYGAGAPSPGDVDRAAHAPPGDRAVVARYARGEDYHRVLHRRLTELRDAVAEQVRGARGRIWVDTGPILERDLARRAGIGWFGRNTMLIDPRRGSYFLLGVLMLDVALEPDAPFEADRCGTCTACLEACPTDALLGRDDEGAPVIDARRCISYLTIELRGSIPVEFREAIGNRVFGCDICQEACPWNGRFGSEGSVRPEYAPRAWPADGDDDPPLPSLDDADLVDFTERVLAMSGKEYQRVFAESPLSRPGRKGMLRNLCVALGNLGGSSPDAAARVRPVLERAAEDSSELVREHAEWGLERLRA